MSIDPLTTLRTILEIDPSDPKGLAQARALASAALEGRATNQAVASHDGWCQPLVRGSPTQRKFLVRFEDAEMGDTVFNDEDEARDFWEKASVAWNCHLSGTLPSGRIPRRCSEADAHAS